MKVLITGGAGFIGTAVTLACIDAGIRPVVVDLADGILTSQSQVYSVRGDIADGRLVDSVFRVHPDIYATIHCAALTGVPESFASPLRYWHANVSRTLLLAEHLIRNGRRRMIFSSSAAIYAPEHMAVNEGAPVSPRSPYARTKACCEEILADLAAAGQLRTLSLRYFNPIGADPRLRAGPARPAHVLGKMLEAREAGRPFVIAGTDWGTRDGTAIRDYVHVADLAAAHVDALRRFDGLPEPYTAVNLGTGTGTTVRELLAAFEEAAGPLPSVAGERRPGDSIGSYAIAQRAWALLRWRAVYPVAEAVAHSVQWAEKCRAGS